MIQVKNKGERGEVVVEASIIVTLSMLVITIMLYVGMILYQQTLVSVMANQTASNLAQVYSNNLKDPFAGYIEPEKVYQSITYSNMKTDAYVQVLEQKANIFAQYRLKSSRILAEGTTSVEVELVKKPNEILKSQLVVTINDKYDMPLVSMFGANSIVEFSSTGRADCVDILEYINGVAAIGDPEGSNVSFLPDSKNCTITFIPDRDNPENSSIVTVFKGHSILSSNRYTHSVMPQNPTKGTLEFGGWVNESGTPFSASTIVNDNIIIYGSWKCSVVLDATGGKVENQDKYSFKVNLGSRASLSNPSRSGYNFGGWYTQKNGGGTRYLSNDTVFSGDVTLYAKWECAHPDREMYKIDGNACEGGYKYFRCTQCKKDLAKTFYCEGHLCNIRCNKLHKFSVFDGRESGGCWGYHVNGQWCNKCQVTHEGVYGYCVVCSRCKKAVGGAWCANNHCSSVKRKASASPVNGHRYS